MAVGRGWGARERRDERVMVRIDDTYVGAQPPPPALTQRMVLLWLKVNENAT